MTVRTDKVVGRRELHFTSFDEVLADIEQLASSNVESLGNWSLGQCFGHLAAGLNMAIDGPQHKASWFIRLIGPLLKRHILRNMSAGFRLPPAAERELVPDTTLTKESGLQRFRDALARYRRVPERKPHSVFGRLSSEEWDRLHLRHAELHLSFHRPRR